jgi:hypothetical protein
MRRVVGYQECAQADVDHDDYEEWEEPIYEQVSFLRWLLDKILRRST